MRRFFVGLLILISALALVLASTSLWTRRHVVNTDVFVAGTEKILTDPAVQARIQSQVVSTVMANPDVQQAIDQAVAVLPPRLQTFRPTIEDGTQNLVGKGVQAILTSAAFSTLTTSALRSAQTQLINGQSVQFTLGQAKALVPPENRTGLAGQVLNLIPDNLGFTVLTKEQAPQVYTAIDLLKSLWLWVGLISLALLAAALVVSRRRLKTLRAWSVTTGVVGLLLVLTMTVARGPLLAKVKPANVNAADAIYQGITGNLRSWTLWLVLIMAGIMVITLLWGRIGIIPAIRRGSRAARARAAQYREERAIAHAARAAAEASGEAGGPIPAEVPSESWPRRVAVGTRDFVNALNLPERLQTLGEFLRNHLRMARWAGVALGALVLLFWPSPTLSVLIWVAAIVALYLGLLELILAIAARGQAGAAPTGSVGPEPAGAAPAAPAPRKARTPAAGDGDFREEPAKTTAVRIHHEVTSEDLTVLGGRLELLMRLGDARTAGVLTEEEFAKEKAELLAL